MPKREIPGAALATVFWVGDMPRNFDAARVIEREAFYAVRMKSHAMALEATIDSEHVQQTGRS